MDILLLVILPLILVGGEPHRITLLKDAIDKMSGDQKSCGCPPKAVSGTSFDTKLLIVTEGDIFLLDILDSFMSKNTKISLRNQFAAIDFRDVNSMFRAFGSYHFLTEEYVIVHDGDDVVMVRPIDDWVNFPFHQVMDIETQGFSNGTDHPLTIEVFTQEVVHICQMDISRKVVCYTHRPFDHLEIQAGLPIHASAKVRDLRIIFGEYWMCLSVYKNQPEATCSLFCPPEAIPCYYDHPLSKLVLVSCIFLLTATSFCGAYFLCSYTTLLCSSDEKRSIHFCSERGY